MEGTKYAKWTLVSQSPDLSGLHYTNEASIPKIRDSEVLVELRAASLNYRDLFHATGKGGPISGNPRVLGSDGAGIVHAVGSKVKDFVVGDHVCIHMVPDIPDDGAPELKHALSGVGWAVDGTLAEYGVFEVGSLVKMPTTLSFDEAATLCCSGLTAWNALMGLRGRELKEGDWVLVQGSGGVSVAALQFAQAIGANVIATTSSATKAAKLKELGAVHTINYRHDENWGETAKGLTLNQRGVDFVIDVNGYDTLPQSIAAVRTDGLIAQVGMRAGGAVSEATSLLAVMYKPAIVRGMLLGSRQQFRDMNRWVDAKGLKPALDDVHFGLTEVKQAFERLERQQHFSKVVIRY